MERASKGSSVSLTEALENYAAHHPETIEELLKWPARKFEHFYIRFQKRQIIEVLARQKDQMVAALWSNSNWDDNKNTRQSAIEQLESQYDEAVAEIKASGSTQSREQEIDKDNPFFAATERGLAKVEQKMGYSPSSKNNEEEIDYMKGLDQE